MIFDRHLLAVMPIVTQVALTNSLTLILGSFIHPALSGVRLRLFVRPGAGPAPQEVLALLWSLIAGGVLHVSDLLSKVVCPLLGIGREFVIPLKSDKAFVFTAIVLDVESGLCGRPIDPF